MSKLLKVNRVVSKLSNEIRTILKSIAKPVSNAMKQEILTSQGLVPYLTNLSQPQDPTPRSKWYGDVSPVKVLNGVRSMLADLRKEGSLEQEIADDDLKAESKVGPQGGHPGINSLLPKLFEYFGIYMGEGDERKPDLRLQEETFSSAEWKAAKREAIKQFQFKGRLRPMSFRKVVEILKNDNKLITNCGIVPGVSFRRRNKPEVIKKVLDLQQGSDWKQPAIIGERSTRGKTRFIFMTSMATNVHGSAYSMVVLDALRKLHIPAFSAWEGQDYVDRSVTSMVSGTKDGDKRAQHCFISTDFTGMDQRFNAACIAQVYDVIQYAFQKSYRDDLKEVMSYITQTPVIFPLEDGTVLESTAEHSLISGSEWTNLVETIFAYIMWIYAKIKDTKALQVLGDDGVALSPWPEGDSANEFSKLSSLIGMTANVSKQLVSSRKLHYLQRYYYTNYLVDTLAGDGTKELGGVYPLMLATNSLLYPERFHDPRKWDKRMMTLRNLMIVENTCDHPRFKEFAVYVGKGDKYLKEFVALSHNELDIVEKQARSIPGFIPSYNQESTERRIYDFRTFKVWRDAFSKVSGS